MSEYSDLFGGDKPNRERGDGKQQEVRHELEHWNDLECCHCGVPIGYWPGQPICSPARQTTQPSRSVQRREALQKGEKMPTFEQVTLEQGDDIYEKGYNNGWKHASLEMAEKAALRIAGRYGNDALADEIRDLGRSLAGAEPQPAFDVRPLTEAEHKGLRNVYRKLYKPVGAVEPSQDKLAALVESWRKLGNDSRAIIIPGKRDGQPTAAGAAMLVCADELERAAREPGASEGSR